MNESKALSIIIPCYNSQNTIERCVNSIIENTLGIDYEIIIINDGSLDDTLSICNKLCQMFDNIYLFNISNSGVSCARNFGLEKARGRYIAFCDSDDYLEGDFYSESVKFAEKNFCDLVVMGMSRKVGDKIEKLFCDEAKFNSLNFERRLEYLKKQRLFNYPFNKIYLKEKITNSFNPNLVLGEDLVFNLDYLLGCSHIVYYPIDNYIYQLGNSGSLSGKFTEDRIHNVEYLYLQISKFYKNKFGLEQPAHIFYDNSLKEIVQHLIKSVTFFKSYSKWNSYIIENNYLTDVKNFINNYSKFSKSSKWETMLNLLFLKFRKIFFICSKLYAK